MVDCCGQEINPIKNRLTIHTNRHPTTNGYSWGWIEGCDKNICWGDDCTFNRDKAGEYVKKHNEIFSPDV